MTEIVATLEQQHAIDYEGNLVAIASPGSGKTFVLSERIRCILPKLKAHQGVVAISYTNKASDELKTRSSRKGIDTKSSFFGTIDRFCASEIIIPFLPQILGVAEEEISISRIRDLSEDEQSQFVNIVENQISLQNIEENLDVLQYYLKSGIVFLETSGALALYTLINSIACQSYIKARYTHVIIDEYQDSGLEQHELFLALHNLGLIAIAVGDSHQSIFGFSNKDSKYLMSLAKHQNFTSFPITFNHRSHPSIINYSLCFLDKNAPMLETDEVRVFYKTCIGKADAIARWIDVSLPQILSDYSVEKSNEVGILVRGGASGCLVDHALKLKHRYFTVHPLEDHFSLWARLFCQLIRYRFNPKHTAQNIVEATSSRLTSQETKSAVKSIKSIRAVSIEDLYVVMEGIALVLLPQAKSDAAVKILKGSSIEQLSIFFAPANDDEIQVMSLHKAKGLEFDVVFHLDLYEWTFPAKRPGPNNDFNNPVYPSLDQDENLHYVGLTRAKKAIFLCTSSGRINSAGDVRRGFPSEFFNANNLPPLRSTSPY